MKTLTIWQPWATLIARTIKTIETRPWGTAYRGDIAIHAAMKKPSTEFMNVCKIIEKYELKGFMPQGKVVCIANLFDVKPVEQLRDKLKRKELELGDYSNGRYAFMLSDVRLLVPVKVRGQQRFWNWLPTKGQLAFVDRPIQPGEQRKLL